MEPHQERKALQPGAEQKPRRFRIIKLEERIAPKNNSKVSKHKTCDCGAFDCWSGADTCWCW